MKQKLLFILLVNLLICCLCAVPNVKVETKVCSFVGTILKTWKNSTIYAFRGIRYAQPPIGILRFKDPVTYYYKNESMQYVQRNGNDCPSIYAKNGSEDCLFLNVYTRKIPYQKNDTLQPVLVFIHPGGFYVGTSASENMSPKYLLEHNLVLVTFNYRLGTLGFLSLGTKDYPGNAGFKDQVEVLKWVETNIQYFGGDPHKITLGGYSAGALSVSLHLVSPISQGLFQQAIIMSGSILPQVKLPNEQIYLAFRQANVLGCNVGYNLNAVIDCLLRANSTQISGTLRKMFDFGKDNPLFLWLPVIEKDFGQKRFLVKDPYSMLIQGNFSQVPILTGFTANELCTSAADIIKNASLLAQLNSNFETLAPIIFMYSTLENKQKITEQIKLKYFGENNQIEANMFTELCNIFSDSLIKFGVSRLTSIVSTYVDVYNYKFSYKGRISNLYYPGPADVLGAEHLDDFMYIFGANAMIFKPSDPETQVIETITGLIASFVNVRNGTSISTFHQLKNGILNFAEISNKIVVRNGSSFETFEFWNSLFPLPMIT